VNEFQVQFLLPGGQNLTMLVNANTPVSDVKESLCREAHFRKNAILLNHTLYEFHTYGQHKVLEDSQLIGTVPYISKCRRCSTTPKLMLIQKHYEPFSAQETSRIQEVTALVGRSVAASDEQEVLNFQLTMARLRYLERKRKKEQLDASGSKKRLLRYSLRLADPTIPFEYLEKIMVSVTFPLLKYKKTIILERKNNNPISIRNIILLY
jgi:hypothetical protein